MKTTEEIDAEAKNFTRIVQTAANNNAKEITHLTKRRTAQWRSKNLLEKKKEEGNHLEIHLIRLYNKTQQLSRKIKNQKI